MGKFDSIWVPNLTAAFVQSYEGTLNNMWSSKITRKIDGVGEFTKLVDLGTVGSVRQFSGPRQNASPTPYTAIVQNLPYELTLEVDIEDVNRDNLGMWEAKSSEIGAKFAWQVDKLAAALIVANPTSLDGTAFFGNAHAIATNINDLSVTQVGAFQTATGGGATPTAAEMMNSIMGAVAYQYRFVDESGDPINGAAKQFLIVTSNPNIYASARTAVSSAFLAAGQSDILKVMQDGGFVFDVVFDPRLGAANSTKWYMFRQDHPIKPFVWIEESAPAIKFLGDGSYNAVQFNKYIWAAKAVRGVAVERYQHALRCTLS
jgi:phage major head subunit gpT-like protein